MKSYTCLALAAASLLCPLPGTAQDQPVVYETPKELFATGDFDGDGQADVVIVDKETGKYRLGYQKANGTLNWVDNRPSGLKGISGLTVGRLLTEKSQALGFTSADANQLTIVDVSNPTAPARPVNVAFTAGLGPNTVVATDIGGDGNTPVADLFVASIYNSPDPSQATLLRNAPNFPALGDNVELAAPAGKGNVVAVGDREYVAMVLDDQKAATLTLDDVKSGKITTAATITGLAGGSDYSVGHFGAAGTAQLIVYKPGESSVSLRAVSAADGKLQVASGTALDVGAPVRRVITLTQAKGQKLLVITGDGLKANVYNYDGVKAPELVQVLSGTNEITAAAGTANGFVLFLQSSGAKFSNKYQQYVAAGNTYTASTFGSLPTLADNDNITIPEIHARIAEKSGAASPADMKLYTNSIPGTRVSYVMVPIPGGEFTMGSPDSEADRNADEGPQHKVKISPFWMGRCEVTWNEYELFMYPDEEKRTRALVATDNAGDKLADAVTHPSKPYVEMSFGMGKEGFPAISMTQHAANKYCQWLSAKTGQFYRLPTEAEWEYAARAGTTTTYFFGDDASKLPEYAWYEQNSDFKYQKVGKKKPNPWGLYDIYGNVVEWVLDQYDPDFYKQCSSKGVVENPWNKATKPYPHAVRGGSWDDEAKRCRSAARRGSERAWKMQDPQLPKSIWYFSDAQWVGFRIVRPLQVPSAEEMQKYWTSGVERD